MQHRLTVFLFLFLCVFASFAAPATAQLYTVENVKVDVTAENAVKARELAFNEAQVKAFEILAERIANDTGVTQRPAPEVDVISMLVKDYEIANEQLSSVRYKADYTIRFDEGSVWQYFTGMPAQTFAYGQTGYQPSYGAHAVRPILVIPFYQNSAGTQLWSPYNPWMKAWQRAGNSDGLVPMIVPIGDLDDVAAIDDDEMFEYSRSNLEEMVKRYGAGEAAIIIAEAGPELEMAGSDEEPAIGELNLHLYKTDNGDPEYVHEIVLEASAGETRGALYDKAVAAVKSHFLKNWKQPQTFKRRAESIYERNSAVASSMRGGAGNLKMRAHFSSLQEWATIQRKLRGVVGVTDMQIQSMGREDAVIAISYAGPQEQLKLLLEGQDLSLRSPASAGYQYSSGGEMVYDLYLQETMRAPVNDMAAEEPAAGGTSHGSSQFQYQSAPVDIPKPYIQRF